MRTLSRAAAVILMTIGLAIFGWVNPTTGVVCLFGGAALWIACQKKTVLVLERLIASKSRRQALEQESAKKRHVREQFTGLSAAEKEAIRHIKLNGHILPQQVASHLANQGFADTDDIVDKVRSRTPFLLGSFSGEFSINPELKELLDELLNPSLLNPAVRGIALVVVVLAILGCGYLFRKYAYPRETEKSQSSAVAPPNQNAKPSQEQQQQSSTPPQNTPLASNVSDAEKRKHKKPRTPQVAPGSPPSSSEPNPAKPSQDNSVRIEKATVNQESKGDCSPNIIGGASTVTCAPPTHWYELDGNERSRVGNDAELRITDSPQALTDMENLKSKKDWAALRDAAENQIRSNPEWPTPYLEASIAYARLCQKELSIQALQTFIDKATVFSRSTKSYDGALHAAHGNLVALKAGRWPAVCN